MAIDTARATADAITRLRNKLQARGLNAPSGYGVRDDFISALCEAILEEIKANAVVTATASNVDPGGGTAPVTGGID